VPALSVVGVAARAVEIVERATCVYTCGSVCYWQTDIDAALAKGYSLYKSGSTLGSSMNSLPYEKAMGRSG
jgi:hypothetical protein